MRVGARSVVVVAALLVRGGWVTAGVGGEDVGNGWRPALSEGAEGPPAATPLAQLHDERPNQPYRTVAPEDRKTRSARPVIRGRWFSVQVNVDERGNDIVGDAANEPSIAVDPSDPTRMAIGWRQFDTVESDFRQAGYGYTADGGMTWTFPGVLEPGVFRSDPVLAAGVDGVLLYDSLHVDYGVGSYDCHVFRSTDAGATWGPPTYAYGGDKPWLAADVTDGLGHGNLYHAWRGVDHFTRSLDSGATFDPPITIPDAPGFGVTAVGVDGEVYVAGWSGDRRAFVVARSSTARDPLAAMDFESVVPVDLGGTFELGYGPNPGGLLGQVWVAVDRSDGPSRGFVYVATHVAPPETFRPDVMFARSTDRGISWDAPVRINDDPPDNRAWHWFATLAVAPNGRIDLVWNDTRADPDGYLSELWYSCSTDAGGTWTANEPLTPQFDSRVGWPGDDHKLGDYYDMVSDDLGARIAYAATFNGSHDVYYLRLSELDCDSNGVADADDLTSGAARDCNGNAVPDRCDIAAGRSADVDGNLEPDECRAPRRPGGGRIGP